MIGDDVVLVIRVPRASRAQRPIYINNDVFGSTFRGIMKAITTAPRQKYAP